METLLDVLQTYGILIISLFVTTVSLLVSFRKNGNTDHIRKILNNLMSIAEFTGLKGEEKKEVVEKIFNDLKVGKVDNLSEYIDDTISFANTININREENKEVVYELELEIDKLTYILIEKENEINSLKEELNKVKSLSVTVEEVNKALKIREEQIVELRKQNKLLSERKEV